MRVGRPLVGTLGGAAGAGLWLAAERPLGRLLDTDYSEVDVAAGALRLVGIHDRRLARAAHVGFGATFGGVALGASGRASWRLLTSLIELELVLAWPVMRRVARGRRRHDRRGGATRAFVDAATGRAILAGVVAAAARGS